METFRILAPNEMRVAYQCQEKDCGFLMIADSGSDGLEAITASCPLCKSKGRKPPENITLKDVVKELKHFSSNGVRFVVPTEED